MCSSVVNFEKKFFFRKKIVTKKICNLKKMYEKPTNEYSGSRCVYRHLVSQFSVNNILMAIFEYQKCLR